MWLRQLKKETLELLSHKDFEKSLEKIRQLPARQVVNPLFSFFYNSDELVRWRAVAAMGTVVSKLADHDMESARVIMRRLIWNLNDESGGIGWGSPEAMGEIMARHGRLAGEYHKILISYIMPDGNYLEHEILQRGVLWGIGRLAHARPHLVKNFADLLCPYMESPDPILRGLAAWAAKPICTKRTESFLSRLGDDNSKIKIFVNNSLVEHTVRTWMK
ncbi:MAG: HEAT repeat domain-containing protein [Deltaproteobacteria bacterium]|nr:HEAT repeat domain-containing protein [Deltaproteobacteria bacterium]